MQRQAERRKRSGPFTLVELLFAVIVVGILAAVAIVGIVGMQDRSTTSACLTTMHAAEIAALAYFSSSGGKYPQTFDQLTSPSTGPPTLTVAGGVNQDTTTLEGARGGWTVTLHPGANVKARTTFTGC